MESIFVENYDEMSMKAFEMLENIINTVNNPVLCLNTGGTPRGLYKRLVEAVNNGLDISDTTIFVLDEYMGPEDGPYTVKTYMKENFLNLIKTQPKKVYFIDGSTENPEEEIKRYKKLLSKYPRHFQLLGVGTNGHIGANEPGTPFDSQMFLADHTQSTIESTRKEYNLAEEETPTQMITLGFSEILEAEKILLLVSGTHKAEATKQMLEDEITEENPVSGLRKHDDVSVIIDQDAASLLNKD